MKFNKFALQEVECKITLRCNLRCFFCSNRFVSFEMEKKKKMEELPTKKWIEIINEVAELGAKKVIITGGEPMLKEGIMKLLQKIKENGLKGRLWTNGTLFTRNSIKRLVKMRFDEIELGLDGSKKEIHDKIRGGKSFDKILQFLEIINELKDKYNAKKPRVCLHFLLLRENYKDVFNVIKLGEKYGCDVSIGLLEFNGQTK
ncbi:MAG: radical SAM protein, partial [Candidatus Aenigmarchaeota archaeon]|nr:radical SAM protein [Candidatus Aenigmarchaeota archaeon]